NVPLILGAWGTQDIAHTAHGVDQRRISGINLAAQVGNIRLHDVAVATEVIVPNIVQNLGLGQHNFFVLHQKAQQVELRWGEINDLAALGHLMGVIIEGQVCIGHGGIAIFILACTTTAQNHAQPGDDLFQAKWLGDIIISPNGQAMNTLVHAVFCGQVQHGAIQAFRAQLGEQLKAIHARHHDIQDVGLRVDLTRNAQRLSARICTTDVKSLEFEGYGQKFNDIRFIVDDQDSYLVIAGVFHIASLENLRHFLTDQKVWHTGYQSDWTFSGRKL